ncbi:disulfide bond formation protein B [Mesorhizobium sp. Z1-4]|uniref:disulfide bond formation protein B n=1 Tax=Mesorhizobium sp. Z1-4 TaxID=2448478 RepID=UPI000FD946BA|nr:disulfide bond formation protein B [Mesorhizobium sp. Z1-4]
MTLTQPAGRTQLIAAILLAAGMAVTVGTALGFQHIGGYIPCKLCLGQRTPYYLGVPLMALAAVSAALKLPGVLTRSLLLAGGALMAYGAYLGGFHAGVEWGWWEGPSDCGAVAAPETGGSGGILDSINTVIPPSCNEAAGRFLGLSFAGWNFVAAVGLALIAFYGAFARKR